uniref:Uncharacterized protein n=1 Tax=Chromera velia CCMP2878 TaxID=1169474 RepID=A0A0G4FGS0_9ALVE|eukprot:Cvel_3307.t1-p1 / transcript=Cvel_3307.t1 / gene=Cvel_3307 / organism=Chromera_velia_CCMP2878 / gene_product=hypothetical protein / transcript_product=hypothetical protein / location=Cvel_scaffold131:47036-48489(-) / protein_length=83 / sequence_SO=supercontig / SO=protein_coding / is_pseudo=false
MQILKRPHRESSAPPILLMPRSQHKNTLAKVKQQYEKELADEREGRRASDSAQTLRRERYLQELLDRNDRQIEFLRKLSEEKS